MTKSNLVQRNKMIYLSLYLSSMVFVLLGKWLLSIGYTEAPDLYLLRDPSALLKALTVFVWFVAPFIIAVYVYNQNDATKLSMPGSLLVAYFSVSLGVLITTLTGTYSSELVLTCLFCMTLVGLTVTLHHFHVVRPALDFKTAI